MSNLLPSEDVLKTVLNNFRRRVDARVIAPNAFRNRIISERVKHKILHAEIQDDANDYMLEHLCSQAIFEDLRKLCHIMKEADGYSNMRRPKACDRL